MKSLYIEKSLGMDIREESISITLLGKKLNAIEILGGQTIVLKPLSGKDEKSEKHFLNKVNQFIVKNEAWPESVVISLPRNHITFKTFELPAPDLESVRSMVPFELERQFSSGLEELYYTFQLTPKTKNHFHITAAAIKKDIANYYIGLIQKLNLNPTVIDVSIFANVNLGFSQGIQSDSSVWALADISSEALDISLIKNDAIEFSRNLSWVKPVIQDIKLDKVIDPVDLKVVSTEITKDLINELQQALSSCRNIEDNEYVGHIFLTGSGVLTPLIAHQLQKETEVSTTVLQAPEAIKTHESFSSSIMLTSLGLGLRALDKQKIETNLLPKDLQPKSKKASVKMTLALAATVTILLAGWFINKVVYTNKTLSTLDKQLSEIKGQVFSLEKIDLEYSSLKRYVDILTTISKKYPDKIPVLEELSHSLPRDTWLTHLKVKQTEIEIKGYAPVASKLIPILEQSKAFKETSFVGTIISESAGEKFTIHADVETTS